MNNIPDVHWLVCTFQWISASKIRYQLLVMSQVLTPMSTRTFYINGVWCWLLLWQLSREKTNCIIKQLLTIEVLDMMLISTTEYQYWPRQLPQSILVFSGGYHIISNTSIVNNCILSIAQLFSPKIVDSFLIFSQKLTTLCFHGEIRTISIPFG